MFEHAYYMREGSEEKAVFRSGHAGLTPPMALMTSSCWRHSWPVSVHTPDIHIPAARRMRMCESNNLGRASRSVRSMRSWQMSNCRSQQSV